MILMKNGIGEEDTGLLGKKLSTLCQLLILFWRNHVFWEVYNSHCNLKLSGNLLFLNVCLICYIHENDFFFCLIFPVKEILGFVTPYLVSIHSHILRIPGKATFLLSVFQQMLLRDI